MIKKVHSSEKKSSHATVNKRRPRNRGWNL